jgi:hypothetical protein
MPFASSLTNTARLFAKLRTQDTDDLVVTVGALFTGRGSPIR